MEIFIDIRIGTNKSTPSSIIITATDTVSSLKEKILSNYSSKLSNLSPERVGLSLKSKETQKTSFLSTPQKQLTEYNIAYGDTIIVKDLGVQISWRGVYVIEYLGPIFIIFLMFYLKGHFNGTTTRSIIFLMSTFHYTKRVLESIYVHEFSRATMPLKNLFINCAYYWGLYGFFCGYFMFFSDANLDKHFLGLGRYIFVILFIFAESKNLKCHLILRKLKLDNNGQKGIPHGEGFGLVSCANYSWEVLAWLSFSMYVMHWSVFVFTFFGLFVMSQWAMERHRSYKKNFGDSYPKGRKAIIPFVY